MPGSRVRVPPLLSTGQSVSADWLVSFRDARSTARPICATFSASASCSAAILSHQSHRDFEMRRDFETWPFTELEEYVQARVEKAHTDETR